VEKELAELRERLSKVEEWKSRRAQIEEELNRVWVEGGEGEEKEELPPPPYLETEGSEGGGNGDEAVESVGEE
jgi:ATP-binding cassette subfamily D (ALD) long-chain fatty acid import protein